MDTRAVAEHLVCEKSGAQCLLLGSTSPNKRPAKGHSYRASPGTHASYPEEKPRELAGDDYTAESMGSRWHSQGSLLSF